MQLNPAKLIFSLILVAAVIAGSTIWRQSHALEISPATASFPLSMPVSGELDYRFQSLSGWQTAQIPQALHFDPPLGTEHGRLVYNAQKFWEMNVARGGHHTGDDLNGIGGMNSDLGDPVRAVADGLVIYTGEPAAGWGKFVIIAHRTSDGRNLHSMYAHLQQIEVVNGALVSRGEKIGGVGTANGYYPAHLHFEIRASDGIDLGAGYSMLPFNRLDPTAVIAEFHDTTSAELTRSPLAQALKSVAPTN